VNNNQVKRAVEGSDSYAVLGVPRDATSAQIKSSYRTLVLTAHPDRNGNSVESTTRFRAVQMAYEELSDPDRRQALDKRLRISELLTRLNERKSLPTTSKSCTSTSPGTLAAPCTMSFAQMAERATRSKPSGERLMWVLGGSLIDAILSQR